MAGLLIRSAWRGFLTNWLPSPVDTARRDASSTNLDDICRDRTLALLARNERDAAGGEGKPHPLHGRKPLT